MSTDLPSGQEIAATVQVSSPDAIPTLTETPKVDSPGVPGPLDSAPAPGGLAAEVQVEPLVVKRRLPPHETASGTYTRMPPSMERVILFKGPTHTLALDPTDPGRAMILPNSEADGVFLPVNDAPSLQATHEVDNFHNLVSVLRDGAAFVELFSKSQTSSE